jgi:hypothetical protein
VCPDVKFCQICAGNAIKETVVDLLNFSSYQDIDLDESPIVVLSCGHLKTTETMDGIMNMSQFYFMDPETQDWRADAFPGQPSDLIPVPACPDCRKPIVGIKRYGRIIKMAQLDQALKRYISVGNEQLNSLQIKLNKLRLRTGNLFMRYKQN